jgi:hypothetical protein
MPKRVSLLIALAVVVLGVFAPAQVNISSPAAVKDQATSATGSATPSAAIYAGGNSSGSLAGIVACDNSAQLTVSRNTTAQLVAPALHKSVYVCGFLINSEGPAMVKLAYGTGSNCSTGFTSITPPFALVPGAALAFGGGLGFVAKTIAGSALCLTNSAGWSANVFVAYTQF